jgi:hypothetical protein
MDEPPDVTTPVQIAPYVFAPVLFSARFVHVIPPPVAVGVPMVEDDRSSVMVMRTRTSFVAGVNDDVVRVVPFAAVELT